MELSKKAAAECIRQLQAAGTNSSLSQARHASITLEEIVSSNFPNRCSLIEQFLHV
jgi:hypothetical protein